MYVDRDFIDQLEYWFTGFMLYGCAITGFIIGMYEKDPIQEHMDEAFREKHKRIFDVVEQIEKERLERLNGKNDSNPT